MARFRQPGAAAMAFMNTLAATEARFSARARSARSFSSSTVSGSLEVVDFAVNSKEPGKANEGDVVGKFTRYGIWRPMAPHVRGAPGVQTEPAPE